MESFIVQRIVRRIVQRKRRHAAVTFVCYSKDAKAVGSPQIITRQLLCGKCRKNRKEIIVSMEILKCEGVTKVYGAGGNQVAALQGIDLSVRKGEFVAVMGASGSGKSTLMHILGNVDKPTEGKVLVDGTDLSQLNQTQAAVFRRRKVGLVYQFYNLIPTLTVRKNILLPLALDKKKPNQEYFEQIVSSLGLSDRLEALPHQLSGGQQQRAAIARSLIYRPALLLADEPTGNLDQKNSREIVDLLKLSNHNLEQTILLITHDEKVALEAERVITVEDGRIVSDERRR